jgi:hypothetical protein
MIFLARKGGSLLGMVAIWRDLYRLLASSPIALWSALQTLLRRHVDISLLSSTPQPIAARCAAAADLRLLPSRYSGRIRPLIRVSYFSLLSFERGKHHAYFPERLRPPP